MGVQIFIYNGGEELITNDKIILALKEVVDPEIGLNVVDLNMIKKSLLKIKRSRSGLSLLLPFVRWQVLLLKK